jgi:hypothetical protein
MLDGHISTCFNKDTHDLFMLCRMRMCQLYRVVFYNCCLIHFIVVQLSFHFHSSFFQLLFSFDSLLFIVRCSKEKIFNSDPGLYSRYFDPAVPLYQKYHHHLCKSINIIHQTAPSLSWYRSEWPITIIDIARYAKPIFSKS